MSGKDFVDATTPRRPKRPNVPAMSRAFVVEGRANETWDPMRDLDASKVLFHETIPIAIRGLHHQHEEEDFRGRETTTISKKTTKNNNNNNATTTMDAMEEEEMERVEIASVRILLGPTASTSAKSRVLRVHVQSEKNPFFSHSMEVNEEEFNFRLKREQNIRVDFNQFPTHFIDLLRECLAGGENGFGIDDDDDDDEKEEDAYDDEFGGDITAGDTSFHRTNNRIRKSQKVSRSADGKKNEFFAVLTLPEEKKKRIEQLSPFCSILLAELLNISLK